MYVNCSGCGSSNRDQDKICYGCGQPLSEPEAQSTVDGSRPSNLAFFCNPSNEVVVRNGPASLPMHAQSAIGKIPVVGGLMMLAPMAIGWNTPFMAGAVAITVVMAMLVMLMIWMASATAQNEAVMRTQGRVIRGEITHAERRPGGRNRNARIEIDYTFTGDSGPIKAQHWRNIGNFSEFTSLKAPEPGTPCYVLYCNDRLYRVL